MWSSGQARVSPGLAPAADSCWPFISESSIIRKWLQKLINYTLLRSAIRQPNTASATNLSQTRVDILISWYLGRYGRNLEQGRLGGRLTTSTTNHQWCRRSVEYLGGRWLLSSIISVISPPLPLRPLPMSPRPTGTRCPGRLLARVCGTEQIGS